VVKFFDDLFLWLNNFVESLLRMAGTTAATTQKVVETTSPSISTTAPKIEAPGVLNSVLKNFLGSVPAIVPDLPPLGYDLNSGLMKVKAECYKETGEWPSGFEALQIFLKKAKSGELG